MVVAKSCFVRVSFHKGFMVNVAGLGLMHYLAEVTTVCMRVLCVFMCNTCHVFYV